MRDINLRRAFHIVARSIDGDVVALELETNMVALIRSLGRLEEDYGVGASVSCRRAGERIERGA